jgi:hypothetical protein
MKDDFLYIKVPEVPVSNTYFMNILKGTGNGSPIVSEISSVNKHISKGFRSTVPIIRLDIRHPGNPMYRRLQHLVINLISTSFLGPCISSRTCCDVFADTNQCRVQTRMRQEDSLIVK